MSGKTSWTYLTAKYGETASLKNFYKLIHTVHKFFTLKISPKVGVILMYPDKTYQYQHSKIHPSPSSFTHRDGLYIRRGGALLLLVMYRFCRNNALYSASLSFTVFTGPAAVARQVLQKRVFILPSLWVFSWNWIISFF